jgi:hypothetical protein
MPAFTDHDHHIIGAGLEQVINRAKNLASQGLDLHALQVRPVKLLTSSLAEHGPIDFDLGTYQGRRCIPVLNALNRGNHAIAVRTPCKHPDLPALAIEDQMPRTVVDDVLAGIGIGINLYPATNPKQTADPAYRHFSVIGCDHGLPIPETRTDTCNQASRSSNQDRQRSGGLGNLSLTPEVLQQRGDTV